MVKYFLLRAHPFRRSMITLLFGIILAGAVILYFFSRDLVNGKSPHTSLNQATLKPIAPSLATQKPETQKTGDKQSKFAPLLQAQTDVQDSQLPTQIPAQISAQIPAQIPEQISGQPAIVDAQQNQFIGQVNPTTLPLPQRKMISIVLDDLGIDQVHTRLALALPAPMTMAFLPYGYNLQTHVDKALAQGHTVMVHLPMEPLDGTVDPGPNALRVGLSEAELNKRINWHLSQFQGYSGVNSHMGSRFTAWDPGMRLVMQRLNQRGLFFLDSLTSPQTVVEKIARTINIAYASRDIFLDHDQNRDAIDQQLKRMETIADKNNLVIAIGHPYATTLAALKSWYANLDHGRYQLIPIAVAVKFRMVKNNHASP